MPLRSCLESATTRLALKITLKITLLIFVNCFNAVDFYKANYRNHEEALFKSIIFSNMLFDVWSLQLLWAKH